jgi:hypothetical protein
VTATALRLDWVHSGTPGSEQYELVRAAPSGAADPHRAEGPDPRGSYRWSVSAPDGRLRASRGYSTLLEEWQSTVAGAAPAGEVPRRAFTESHVVPWAPGARLRIERRGPGADWRTLAELALPGPEAWQPAAVATPGRELRGLHGSGPLHLLIVAEGWTAAEREAFFAAARRTCDAILRASPYAEQVARLRLSALFVASPGSGIPARPDAGGDGTAIGTAFGSTYGTFGMARYLVATDLHALGRAADGIACHAVVVLCNGHDYGGSGIFNSNCCVAAGMDDADFDYVLLHELGHSLGGLGDEYFGKEVTYTADEAWAAWEPNVSALDGQGRVKWSARLPADLPVPTPWDHTGYLRLMQEAAALVGPDAAARQALLRQELARLLQAQPGYGQLGAYEGARYQARGMFRPEVDCRMFSRTARRFCAICQDTLAVVIAGAR